MEQALTLSILQRAAVFPSMPWPQQQRLLDELNVLSCKQQGKTWGEAQRKRAPIDALNARLQRLHDAQVAAWIATP